MTLKELLGDAYKEGITEQEIDKLLADRKIVDLKGGNYVDKDKYEKSIARQVELEAELNKTKDSYKNYDDLLKFKTETDAKIKKDTLKSKLKEAGFKDEFLDYAMYQVDSGVIADNDKIVDNAKKFLEANKQYQQVTTTNPNPNPTLTTIINGNGQNGSGTVATPVATRSWNKNRSF